MSTEKKSCNEHPLRHQNEKIKENVLHVNSESHYGEHKILFDFAVLKHLQWMFHANGHHKQPVEVSLEAMITDRHHKTASRNQRLNKVNSYFKQFCNLRPAIVITIS